MKKRSMLIVLQVVLCAAVVQAQEHAEVARVALVRRGRHQQVVVRQFRQPLAELIGQRLVLVVRGAQLVRLVHDHQVPAAAQQAQAAATAAAEPPKSQEP